MYLNKDVSLFKENIKQIIGSMWMAENHGYGAWSLVNSDHCQLHCSSCGLHFYPKGFPEEDEQEGVCPSLPKVSKTFHSPSPLNSRGPAANMTAQPDLFDWHSHPYTAARVSLPGLSLPLALWHVGPDSKCHVTSPHGTKAPLWAGNPNRWLKCLQRDSPRQPGRCTEPCH